MPEMTRPTNSHHERRRERHQDVVEAEPEVRRSGSPAGGRSGRTARRSAARTGTASAPRRCRTGRAPRPRRAVSPPMKPTTRLRQHRDDDAERQHVEQHGDEDEREAPARHAVRLALICPDSPRSVRAARSCALMSSSCRGERIVLLAQGDADRRAGQVETRRAGRGPDSAGSSPASRRRASRTARSSAGVTSTCVM